MRRSPRSPALVISAGVLCVVCSHPRSSHSMLILSARCKAQDCQCDNFEPVCGCQHVLSMHLWSVPSDPWGCASCPCKGFGPAPESSPVYQAALFDMTR